MTKIQFCLSASGLPNLGGLFAALSYNEHRLGKTEAITGSTRPLWRKLFVVDIHDIEEASVTVSISSTNNNKGEVGHAQFDVAALMGQRSGVLHEDLIGGGTIYVHASEHMIRQSIDSFNFQIHGKDLTNKGYQFGDFSRTLVGSVKVASTSDGPKSAGFYYELRSAGNVILHSSEAMKKTLDPEWSAAEVSLHTLCHGDFDAIVIFDFFHKDPLTRRKLLLGSLKTTVNNLMIAAAHGRSMMMRKDDERTGEILVLRAECVGFTESLGALLAAAEARDLKEATSLVAASKAAASKLTEEELESARREEVARRKSELLAKTALAEAREAAERAKTESLEAAKVAKEIREAGLMGTLKFQFRGKALKNVDWFLDKSDPFFVLQKVASEKDGQFEWSHVYLSEVVMNDLDPIWKDCEVEVGQICSGDLDEPIRIVVFDWEKSGKHKLIGSFETTVNGIISAQRSEVEVPLNNGNEGTGYISVPYAEVVGFVDPTVSAKRAEELAEHANNARFFAKGAEHRVNIAGKTATRAQNAALEIKQTFDTATEEANAARRRVTDKTVSQRLGDLGLGT